MFGRRILVMVAVLMGLTALAASLAPPPQPTRHGRAGRVATPAPTRSAGRSPGAGRTVTARLQAGGPPRQVSARVGDLVDITVTGDVIDTVTIPGLALTEPIAPESPALLQAFAFQPGSFPIGLLDSRRRLGVLRVRR